MKRDISLLRDQTFDAVVIGGGIHGATAFQQLAAAGLKTALIEKDDFGSGTSANSLKILHSGLRYLQLAQAKDARNPKVVAVRELYFQVARKYGIEGAASGTARGAAGI